MILIILLFVSIVLQTMATVVAMHLIRHTKYNASWILIIIALTVISIQRIDEFLVALNNRYALGWKVDFPVEFKGWSGVVASLCLAVSMFMIQQVFDYIARTERERRLSEERILKVVIEAEERERGRLAKELHDGLGPLLSMAQMSISAIVPEGASQKAIVDSAENAMAMAIKTLREVSNNLSPHVLENFGVARAISALIKNFTSSSDIDVRFNNNIVSVRFPAQLEITIYRVVSELMNNTLKHSQATIIYLSIELIDHALLLIYRDNGCGFDPHEASGGMGLSNIESRVGAALGQMNIISHPGQGMSVNIKFQTELITTKAE